jgi:hypothetical protein
VTVCYTQATVSSEIRSCHEFKIGQRNVHRAAPKISLQISRLIEQSGLRKEFHFRSASITRDEVDCRRERLV